MSNDRPKVDWPNHHRINIDEHQLTSITIELTSNQYRPTSISIDYIIESTLIFIESISNQNRTHRDTLINIDCSIESFSINIESTSNNIESISNNIDYHWLTLINIDYHQIKIDQHRLSSIITINIDQHWSPLIIIKLTPINNETPSNTSNQHRPTSTNLDQHQINIE